MTDPEKSSPAVSPAQASAAGLLVAFLLFALAGASFVVVNLYWPAVRNVVTPPSKDLTTTDKASK
jgi:hypothetical protein